MVFTCIQLQTLEFQQPLYTNIDHSKAIVPKATVMGNELPKDELIMLHELTFYWMDGAHKFNLESHRMNAPFSHLTLCVWQCCSPVTILT